MHTCVYVCVCLGVSVLVQQWSMQSATKCMNKQELDLNRATESRAEPTSSDACRSRSNGMIFYEAFAEFEKQTPSPLLPHPPFATNRKL